LPQGSYFTLVPGNGLSDMNVTPQFVSFPIWSAAATIVGRVLVQLQFLLYVYLRE